MIFMCLLLDEKFDDSGSDKDVSVSDDADSDVERTSTDQISETVGKDNTGMM